VAKWENSLQREKEEARMKKRQTREEKWQELEERVKNKLEEARKRALLADSFAQMEEIADQIGQDLEEALLGAMAEQQEPMSRPTCPECGVRMSRRGQAKRQLKTRVGKVELERDRWSCPQCESGIFPPGPETEA
jgi:hypothetical protein